MLKAYSYLRFSDPKQATGDSLKRQSEVRGPWLAAHPDVTLDTALRMTDKGIGAFRGRHRSDKHCFGQFIRHVEKGTVKPGSKRLVAVGEMSRGHSECLMKSKRISAAWRSARDRARTTGEVVNLRTLPGWIEIRDGKQRLIPERAAVIRRVRQMARHGYGVNLITKELNADRLKPWGRAALWSEAVVHRLTTARTVIGE
ncbi:MAG: hypothetical protein K2P78_01960 [Gemmataceae bacterium]|nr:hypothetical protein [Gemmataceae bacterium]